MAIYLGVHAFWNYRRAEVDRWKLQAQAETARLEALKLQLNPHFFFNSLASVRALISEAPQRARKMVARLARLLRTTLQTRDQKTTPLQEELSVVRTYLRLEKVRFEDRLDWTINASEKALQCHVPFMLVQTLTENAVKHGIGQHQGGGTVTIAAGLFDPPESERSEMLRLRVSNPGELNGTGDAQGSGTGLDNAQKRLRLLFGEAADLQLNQSGPETVTAVVTIPQRLGEPGVTDRNETPLQRGAPTTDGVLSEQDRLDGISEDSLEGPLQSAQAVPRSSRDRSAGETDDVLTLLAGHSTYWICQALGWGLLGVGNTMVNINQEGNWRDIGGDAVFAFVAVVGVGVGLTHIFRVFAKRRGWANLSPRKLAPRIIVSALLLGSIYVLPAFPTYVPADPPSALWPRLLRIARSLIPPALSWSGLMGAWLAIYFSVHAFWNYRQAEIDRWKLQARAKTARLEALKLQLNPHFFFNSLASVRSLIGEAPERARKMVGRLARLLREALQTDDEETVSLQDELSTVKTYLNLEKVRFEDRLDWTIDASETALQRPVPFMLVQTLTENAVKHGIGQRRTGGTIQIEAIVADGDSEDEAPLCLQVTNPGTLDTDADPESDTGLENARERLRLLFGEGASLELTQRGPETVAATAWIPCPTALEDRYPEEGDASVSLRIPDDATLGEAKGT
ncbi:MAG: sensor histidine kinase [Salinibacter sp.]